MKDPKGSTFKTWTRWGRVGEGGQKAVLGNGALADAIKQFEKKFKDKSGLSWENRGDNPKPGKYAFIERSYDPDSDDDEDEEDAKAVKKEGDEDETPAPECTLEKPVKELMELIFNQQYFQATMTSLNYDAKKLPLGKLSKATITRGFQQLKDLAALLDDPTLAASKWGMSMPQATEYLSNTFYTVIPHAFGRNRPPVIRDNSMLKKEIELLESLSDMKDAADIMKIDRKTLDTVHPLDRQFQGLGLEEMTPLDRKSNEFVHLENYLNESRGATHHMSYEVQDIFRIERQGETQRFDNSEYATIKSDRRLLWHGSRCTNFGGILSQGLRIAPPEAPVSGYMFGKGIYLADMSSKSAGYCCSYISNGHALLLLCEAELGDPLQKLTQADYDAGDNAKAKGMHSTWGQGNTGPSKWVDAGFVHESLKGIKMVSFLESFLRALPLTMNHSPIPRSSQARLMLRTPLCTTTSTSATTSLKSSCAISFASRSRRPSLPRWQFLILAKFEGFWALRWSFGRFQFGMNRLWVLMGEYYPVWDSLVTWVCLYLGVFLFSRRRTRC